MFFCPDTAGEVGYVEVGSSGEHEAQSIGTPKCCSPLIAPTPRREVRALSALSNRALGRRRGVVAVLQPPEKQPLKALGHATMPQRA